MRIYNSCRQLAVPHRYLALLLAQRRTTSFMNCPTAALESYTKQTSLWKDTASEDFQISRNERAESDHTR
jgi:hypothetical protein